MIDASLLDVLPLAARLTPAARRELAARAVLSRFDAGQALFHAGDEARGLLVILEGRVRVLRGTPERTHVLHEEGPGGTLGEVPVFGGGDYLATAVAAEPVRALFLAREDLRAALSASPELAWLFLERLARRVRTVAERLESVAGRNVSARLARLVLRRAAEARARTFTLGRTQSEVAEELGTVREVVVRSLRELRTLGLLRSAGGGRYAVLDADALQRLAQG